MLETAISHAKALGLEDLVEFSGYRDDVNDILPTFDAFLLTSAIEGLPNVLIEAQSKGFQSSQPMQEEQRRPSLRVQLACWWIHQIR